MKTSLLFSFILIFFIHSISSQIVNVVLHSVNKSQVPLFSKVGSKISVDLVKQYELNHSDTSYFVNISITNTSFEVTGMSASLGGMSLGLLSGNSSSVSVEGKTNKDVNSMIIDRSIFSDFYNCISSAFMFIHTNNENLKETTITTCSVDKCSFSMQRNNNADIKYIFKFDNVFYEMNIDDFRNIMNVFSRAKVFMD
ncbi:MAG: hypothetical protein ACM3PT_10940 [Deltaproteobacteria bacterium]